MPYGLHLTILSEVEHTIDSGTHTNGPGVVLRDAEGAELLAFHEFHPIRLFIIYGFAGPEEPVLAIRYRRSEVQILE